MPIYTYKCNDCELEVERMMPLEMRDYLVQCPACANGRLHRQLDTPNFTMNRRGWDSGKAYEEKGS